MTTLFLDLETFSDVPITHGTHAYAEKAEVLLIAVAIDDGPVAVIGPELDYLQELVDEADTVVIHNSAFDRTILAHNNVRIPVARVSDTMVRALAHGLPGSLGQLCDILGVPVDKAKDKRGKKLIQLFTKPRPKNMKLRRATAQTHAEEWAEFVEYARLDVEAMREVHKRLPSWNSTPAERSLWALDQRINDRGIAVDLDLARAALRAAARAGAGLADRAKAATGGAVGSLTQRDKLLAYLSEAHDYTPEDMTKGTVTAALKGELEPAVRELLEIRQQASATSPAKYKVLVNATSSDGRLRGTLQFCGAQRTGRWCLAEGTRVLVRSDDGRIREVPIESVSTDDQVWDGEAWVRHEGVVFSGEKTVVEHDGVVATAEHIVYLSATEHITLGQAKAEGRTLWTGNGTQFTA